MKIRLVTAKQAVDQINEKGYLPHWWKIEEIPSTENSNLLERNVVVFPIVPEPEPEPEPKPKTVPMTAFFVAEDCGTYMRNVLCQ